jgi:hypothetical protein
MNEFGLMINGRFKVNPGNLFLTRCLGLVDVKLKYNFINPEPEVRSFQINPVDDFLFLGSIFVLH